MRFPGSDPALAPGAPRHRRTRAHLGLVELLLPVGDLVPNDGPDVLDDHGVLLDVPGSVQAQPLQKHARTPQSPWLLWTTGLRAPSGKGPALGHSRSPGRSHLNSRDLCTDLDSHLDPQLWTIFPPKVVMSLPCLCVFFYSKP